VTTTFQRLAGKKLPADGADVCGMVIGSQDLSAKAPAGCK